MRTLAAENREMTLGEFIAEMHRGWGFVRPYNPRQIAKDLDKIIPAEDRGKLVQVNFSHWMDGWGPGVRYLSRWQVVGYIPSLEGIDYVHKIILKEDGFVVTNEIKPFWR